MESTAPAISSGAVMPTDNDGDLDLVVNNINDNVFIYMNRRKHGVLTSHQVERKKGNSNAVGSKLYLYANGSMQYRGESKQLFILCIHGVEF
jgi:hypothetical protein